MLRVVDATRSPTVDVKRVDLVESQRVYSTDCAAAIISYGSWESQLAEDHTLANVACSHVFREEGSFPDRSY